MNGRRFIVPIAASAALVLSAPFIGQLRAALQDAFPGQYTRIIAGAVFGSLALALVVAIARIRPSRASGRPELVEGRQRRALRYGAIAAAGVIGTTYALLSRTGDPAVDAVERFHFVEYGLITLLFYQAWRPVGDASLLVLPVLAGLFVGVCEEWLQWFVPSRVGEMRDIFLNLWAIVCGLLFSLALDPPERLAPSLRHESWTRIRHLAALVLLAFGVFVHSVHLGYRIHDSAVGEFRSTSTSDQLHAEAQARADAWRANPPLTWARLSREDQFLTEAVTHVRKRNQCWDHGDFRCAWHENLILERYFAVVLDTPTYYSPTGHRWLPEQRDNAALEARKAGGNEGDDGAASYVSEADDPPILVWPKTLFWLVLGAAIVGIMAPARRSSHRGRVRA